jgi:AcrR family transcriptional regulator
VDKAPTRPALRARYERRRADVVAAAARTFAERGYHGTSIDDLIEATGLTRGGLYHYTDSKEALLIAVLDELMDPLLERGVRSGAFRTADPQLTLLALLGMANYTAQWYAPRGRLSAEQIADGYCDMLL